MIVWIFFWNRIRNKLISKSQSPASESLGKEFSWRAETNSTSSYARFHFRLPGFSLSIIIVGLIANVSIFIGPEVPRKTETIIWRDSTELTPAWLHSNPITVLLSNPLPKILMPVHLVCLHDNNCSVVRIKRRLWSQQQKDTLLS